MDGDGVGRAQPIGQVLGECLHSRTLDEGPRLDDVQYGLVDFLLDVGILALEVDHMERGYLSLGHGTGLHREDRGDGMPEPGAFRVLGPVRTTPRDSWYNFV